MNLNKRVVVTGLGAISSLGTGVSTLWNGLLASKSGVAPITNFDCTAFRNQIAGEIKDLDITNYIPAKEAKRLDPFCHYAIVAGDEAVKHAGINKENCNPDRIGVLVSSGIGGIDTLQKQCKILLDRGPRRNSPLTVPMMIIDIASGFLSIRYGFRGPNLAIVTACASSNHSIGEAMWMIKRGDADVMLAGGAEACVNPLGLTGFNAMKALSTRNDDPEGASRPFDATRDGFVPAEGSGVLVLESLEHALARKANILAELTGYGLSGDAYHITAPTPDGNGAARAITAAIKQADVSIENIDYINAHGTSTPLNDKTESMAIKRVFGEKAYKIPISSTKSMIGHTLGAAGALESIVCIQSLMTGTVHGTKNFSSGDEFCDLDYIPSKSRIVNPKTVLNLNLGFGGHNAALVFKKWE